MRLLIELTYGRCGCRSCRIDRLEWRWVMAQAVPGSFGIRFAPMPPICRHPDACEDEEEGPCDWAAPTCARPAPGASGRPTPQCSPHSRRSRAVGPTPSRWSWPRCGRPAPCTDPAIHSSHARSAGSRRPARRRARGFEVHPPAVEAVARRRRCRPPREPQPVVRQATPRGRAARAGRPKRGVAPSLAASVGRRGARPSRLDMDRDGRRSEADSGCLGAATPRPTKTRLAVLSARLRSVAVCRSTASAASAPATN